MPYVENEKTPKPGEVKQDYHNNYHVAKLTFGLILMFFRDVIREGDGDRFFDTYKVALLLYDTHGHYKYASALLLHLGKRTSYSS